MTQQRRPSFSINARQTVFFAIAAALLCGGVAAWVLLRKEKPAQVATAYADPSSCARCHQSEAAGYARTGMAHAFYTPSAGTTLDSPAKERQFFHAASGTYYSMDRDGERFVQRRWQTGFDGKPENVEQLPIDYVMGSGNHVRTFLHREADGTLIELPLAWYAESGGHWGTNPGFDNAHPMTRRPIAYECMFCHNGYPEIPSTAHRDLTANAVYAGAMPQGIDCQRCHGPGAAHVKAAQSAGVSLQQVREAIFQPTRASREKQMEVCEQCHLETTSRPLPDRVRRYEREPFGYNAGEPLSAFNLYFDKDEPAKNQERFEIVNGPYRLRQSQCFLKSQGALTCESCHNPHDLHKGPESAEFYAGVCMKCHGASLPAKIAAKQHPVGNDCVSCHMPKRRTDDVIHAVMTDHLIQRHAPPAAVLLAAKQEIVDTPANAYHGRVARYLRDGEQALAEDATYETVAQVIDGSNSREGIAQLQAVVARGVTQPNFAIELGDALRHSGDLDGAVAAYRKALAVDPLSSRAQRRLGAALGEQGNPTEALAVLQAGLKREPGNALMLYEKALVEARAGSPLLAIEDLKQCLKLKADFADAENNLGSNLALTGDAAGAEAAFRRAMQIDPYNSGIRANLGRALAGRGQWKEAAFHLRRAVVLDDANVAAHTDLAVTLLQLRQEPQAEAEVRAAIRVDGRSAAAHDLLGQLELQQGRKAAAQAEFEAALAANPGFGPAQLDLAEMLLAAGKRDVAAPLLRKAAGAPQPAIAQRARALMEQAGVR